MNQEQPMNEQEINSNEPSTSVNGESMNGELMNWRLLELSAFVLHACASCFFSPWFDSDSGEPQLRKDMTVPIPTPKRANPEGVITKHFQKLDDYYQYIDTKCKELEECYYQFLDEQKASSDYYLEPTELW